MTRLARIALPVAALVLGLTAPALGADTTVKVEDDFLNPSAIGIAPGDTTHWNWTGLDDHDLVTNARQIDRFRSGIRSGPGVHLSHRFKYPGRFHYFCLIHPDTMQGVVAVGTDDGVAPKITKLGAKVAGSRVKLTFKLSERSVVTAKVKGRKAVVKTFGPGKHAIRFKGLSSGRHKAKLSAKDGFGHKGTRSKRFTTH